MDLPIPNLHPDLEGLRIAQISDLHVSPYLSVREAGRVRRGEPLNVPKLLLFSAVLPLQLAATSAAFAPSVISIAETMTSASLV